MYLRQYFRKAVHSFLRPAGHRSRCRARTPSYRPRLEALETRELLSTFTVVLATDNGGQAGQKVTATTGDLRYCVEKADAAHTATSDTIGFSSLFSVPQIITLNSANGPLVLSDSHPLTINAPAARTVTVSGGNATEVFDVASGTVTMKNLTISHGSASNGGGIYNQGTLTVNNCFFDHDSTSFVGYGGGIFNAGTLTLTKCTLYVDSASFGGGIANYSGTATLTNCNLSNDMANGSGGGIFNSGTVTLTNCSLSNDKGISGGGIFNYVAATVTLANCTLSNDDASDALGDAKGGGIFNDGGLAGGGTVMLTNCTLANNVANAGGAIFTDNHATVTLTSCTVSNNSASSGLGGGGIYVNLGILNLTNTIIAGNTAGSWPDIYGSVATADHNLIGDATGSSGITNGVNGNIVGGNGNPVIDARLGPLQNNGGPTETMALLADSPAIGHADNAAAPAKDQRGNTRMDETGEITDIGAFELT